MAVGSPTATARPQAPAFPPTRYDLVERIPEARRSKAANAMVRSTNQGASSG